MENKTDKFFRDKLLSFDEKPSSNAWTQIENELAAGRKNTFYRKIAVAASLILLVGLGYAGLQTLDSVSVLNQKHRTRVAEKDSSEQSFAPGEVVSEENTVLSSVDAKPEKSEPTNETGTLKVETTPTEKKLEYQNDKNEKIKLTEEKSSATAGEISALREERTEQNIVAAEEIQAEALQENIITDEIDKSEIKTKTYPKVTITYKVSKSIAEPKKNIEGIFNKGLNKLTKFKDERLLTEERKTKLRNTTENLLALNFGKLLNKSNKEFEN